MGKRRTGWMPRPTSPASPGLFLVALILAALVLGIWSWPITVILWAL